MKKNLKVEISIIVFALFTMILNLILKHYPKFVDRVYSTSLNRVTRQLLSIITGVLPFSLAEILVPLLVLILIGLFITLVMKIKSGEFLKHFLILSSYASLLYILFMFLWGFNYNRLPLNQIMGLEIKKASKSELSEICNNLIKKANNLRTVVQENSEGVIEISGGYKDIFNRAQKGYDKASEVYKELEGKYGPPKAILLSEAMSYTGITGIYMPYTGEANVNVNEPDMMLPATVLHEMAHQRGFAREDEANYIAYLSCSMHPDVDFQYSGVMLALTHSMNALSGKDMDEYIKLTKNYSEGVRRDLRYYSSFWKQYEGKVEEASNKINDNYLKSNGQGDGVESYGRMVDLLIAEYRKKAM